MITVETHDNKTLQIGDGAKATIVGFSVVIQRNGEVYLITPISNIKSLVKES